MNHVVLAFGPEESSLRGEANAGFFVYYSLVMLDILVGNFVEFPSHFYDFVVLIQLIRRISFFN